MPKTVRVHDDTHRALMRLKARRRCHSLDEVIREMVKAATGASVREEGGDSDTKLPSYVQS